MQLKHADVNSSFKGNYGRYRFCKNCLFFKWVQFQTTPETLNNIHVSVDDELLMVFGYFQMDSSNIKYYQQFNVYDVTIFMITNHGQLGKYTGNKISVTFKRK